jgi:L-ascorbate metabolism protein UlaG (beta-lactamase superfamily)
MPGEGLTMNLALKLLLLATLLTASLCGQAVHLEESRNEAKSDGTASLEITYIANEGVLIAASGKRVLIDGLHREYKPDYAFLPPDERKKIEGAEAPFDKIDLILVSHLHLDHFHPEAIGLHLKNNPRAMLVSSDQIVDSLSKDFKAFEDVKGRVERITPKWKEKVKVKVAGVELVVLGLRHGNKQHHWIQNLGHIVKIGDKKLLHLGDAETSVENFQSFALEREQIDVAFIPYWFLLYSDGQKIVRDYIKPKHIIAVHISPAEADEAAKRIRAAFPEATSFTRLLETKTY